MVVGAGVVVGAGIGSCVGVGIGSCVGAGIGNVVGTGTGGSVGVGIGRFVGAKGSPDTHLQRPSEVESTTRMLSAHVYVLKITQFSFCSSQAPAQLRLCASQ